MLKYNKSKMPQVINTNSIIKVVIPPGGIIEDGCFPPLLDEFFGLFDSTKFYNQKLVTVRRDFALGDLIMLIPVLRKFKEYFNISTIQVMTAQRFLTTCQKLFPEFKFVSDEYMYCINLGLFLNLNSVLEMDHSVKNTEKNLHRCFIYASSIGFEIEGLLDWSAKSMKKTFDIKTERKKIGVQIRGSGVLKTIPFKIMLELINKLSETYHVIPIDHECYPQIKNKEITNLTGKLNVCETIELLRELDACITMDSGVLWMAHIANCPVVTLLGPTRESERINLHPQYPEKAKGINLAEMVGCTPCFETKIHCKGKINCMNNFDKNLLFKNVFENIKSILGDV
jgi:ADP-heptose:LPS heptosyltransferase